MLRLPSRNVESDCTLSVRTQDRRLSGVMVSLSILFKFADRLVLLSLLDTTEAQPRIWLHSPSRLTHDRASGSTNRLICSDQ